MTVKEKFAGSEKEFAGLRQQIASENQILSENLLQDLILPARYTSYLRYGFIYFALVSFPNVLLHSRSMHILYYRTSY